MDPKLAKLLLLGGGGIVILGGTYLLLKSGWIAKAMQPDGDITFKGSFTKPAPPVTVKDDTTFEFTLMRHYSKKAYGGTPPFFGAPASEEDKPYSDEVLTFTLKEADTAAFSGSSVTKTDANGIGKVTVHGTKDGANTLHVHADLSKIPNGKLKEPFDTDSDPFETLSK